MHITRSTPFSFPIVVLLHRPPLIHALPHDRGYIDMLSPRRACPFPSVSMSLPSVLQSRRRVPWPKASRFDFLVSYSLPSTHGL
jgi:hypothetical protein